MKRLINWIRKKLRGNDVISDYLLTGEVDCDLCTMFEEAGELPPNTGDIFNMSFSEKESDIVERGIIKPPFKVFLIHEENNLPQEERPPKVKLFEFEGTTYVGLDE